MNTRAQQFSRRPLTDLRLTLTQKADGGYHPPFAPDEWCWHAFPIVFFRRHKFVTSRLNL